MSLFTQTRGAKSVVALALISAAVGLSACSQSASPDVEARENIMKDWGNAVGIMGDMIEAPDTFDAAKFQEQAAYLADSADSPWTHFQDENAVGGAMETVWSDADGFSSKVDNFKQATDALNQAAQGASSAADVQPAFAEVGASCKACHTDYRAES